MKENISAIDFIKKVGKGKTLSKDLTFEEAQNAMNLLLGEHFTDAQMGAFLQALRIKELSQIELNAFLNFCYQSQIELPLDKNNNQFVINLSSDTPRKGGILTIFALALLIQKKKIPLLIHSRSILSKNEVSFNQSLSLVKIFFPDEFELLSQRIVCVDSLIPNWNKLDTVRSELGFRSCLHTLEKMITPDKKSPMLIGISHQAYALKMLKSLLLEGVKAKIVLGNHGTIDLLFHKPNTILSLDNQQIKEEHLSLEDLKLKIPTTLYSLSQFSLWESFLQDHNHSLWKAIHFQAAGILKLNDFFSTLQDAWDFVNS